MLPLFEALKRRERAVAVVGLGYVGLPLAVHLSRHYETIGFDIDATRIARLRQGVDDTREVNEDELHRTALTLTSEADALGRAAVIIVAVPTPVDSAKQPDFKPLVRASETIGRVLAKGSVVVFESTVYPGATEEICVPVLEAQSRMRCGSDFYVGYSPERINPGDKNHTLDRIVKVVAGQTPEVTDLLAQVYGAVVTAGIHKAPSIKTAEAAKVIENTQRDLNIALMNELAIIFNTLGLDTKSVLEAASTKWNFLPFTPGLVGGHCIGVDPYYLTHAAERAGHLPEVILSGRRINDGMGKYIAEQTVKQLIKTGTTTNHARIGVLGLSFKENVPDLRNSKVVDVIRELISYGAEVSVADPLVDPGEARAIYGIELRQYTEIQSVDALILAVPHAEFLTLGPSGLRAMSRSDRPVLVDVKSALDRETFQGAGFSYWRL